ncbi:MAG: flagellar hook-length control protein FliK [Planctomycetes bacterium]|nr:flagellar hook-length control protein FliK [Planctomycetota bacterium]
MSAGRPDAFENVLQERLVADRDRAQDTPAPRAEEQAPPAEEPVAPEEEVRAPREREVDDAEPAVAEDATPTDLPDQADAQPFEIHDTTRRGEPERQETAGKGADSPRPYSRPGEQVLVTVLNPGAAGTGSLPVAVAGNGNAVGAIGAAKAAGQPMTRAAGLDAQLPNTPQRGQAVTAGYRTNNAASAQLLEQARDSVFKQILLKLNDDGGEMRMRLSPPELGELDLRLSVSAGNRLHLAISAERDDMAQLLQQHLDELTRSLQSAGLDVAGAHVEARSEGSRRDLHDAEFGGASPEEQDEITSVSQPRLGGWMTAEGLDYWA